MPTSIRTQLSLLLVALAMPLVGVVGYSVYRNAQDAIGQAQASQRTLSAMFATNTARRIATTREMLLRLADRPLVKAVDEAHCDGVLKDLLTLNPGFANIAYSNLQGRMVCSAVAQPGGRPIDVGATDWFREVATQQRFSIGRPVIGPITGVWVSVLSTPIWNERQEMVGAVHIPLDLNGYNPGLSETTLPADSRFGLFDAQGVLIWRNQDPEKIIGTKPDWKAATKMVAQREGDFEDLGADGIMRFYSVTSVPESDWVAFFGVPSNPTHAMARERAIIAFGTSLLGLAFLAGLALILARRIERPIRSLALAATGISQGNKAIRATPSGPRELVVVAQKFNAMVAALLGVEAEIERHRRQLQAAKEQIDHVVQVAQVGMWELDLQSGTIHCDPILAELCGYTHQEMRKVTLYSWRERIHPDDLGKQESHLQDCIQGATDRYEAEHRTLHKNGQWIWGQWKGHVTLRDHQGIALSIIGSFQDITERKVAYENLQLTASVFTHAREGITITDTLGTMIAVNDTFTQITGYSREDVLGQNPRILQSGLHGPEYYEAMWQGILDKDHWSGEIWNRRKNGEVYAEIITISAVRDAAGKVQHFVALFSDISAIKENERRLEHLAHYDALTGLPNRMLMADRLQQAMAQCQRKNQFLAVAFLDLDGFKAINDRHGHVKGDKLLVALAHRLKGALREGDVLARIGGDEFVIVLVDLEQAPDCEPILERLLRAAAEPVQIDNTLLQVSASIGVTLYPHDHADADLLMRHADQAMYLAKQAGKNRFHLFDVAHDTALTTQHQSLERIRGALDRREFVLYYQPKVNMRTGAVIGAEALIRWQHPEQGLLPPGAFLPAINDHAIGVELGEWVIAAALGQMTAWKAAGVDIPVSVNISARQLQEDDFAQRLSELLERHPDVPPQWLELEILETSAMEDIALVSDVLRRCQAIGVRFALDDFGTGYSSLTYLKRLSAEMIKIDQSFVRDMQRDTDDLAIVTGVIGLAAAFGREVIAEGVETAAIGAMLLPLGCELAQGYGIARPMPASALPGWIQDWRPDTCWGGL